MVVNEVVVKHLEHLRLFHHDLMRYREGMNKEEFLRDRDKENMVLFALLEAVQLCIDLGTSFLRKAGGDRKPTEMFFRSSGKTIFLMRPQGSNA